MSTFIVLNFIKKCTKCSTSYHHGQFYAQANLGNSNRLIRPPNYSNLMSKYLYIGFQSNNWNIFKEILPLTIWILHLNRCFGLFICMLVILGFVFCLAIWQWEGMQVHSHELLNRKYDIWSQKRKKTFGVWNLLTWISLSSIFKVFAANKSWWPNF